ARLAAVDEHEGLPSLLDNRAHEPRDRLARGGEVPYREVGERDPPIVVDAKLERDRSEVRGDVAGSEPRGDLLRVGDRGGKRHDLQVGVVPSEPRETHLERWARSGSRRRCTSSATTTPSRSSQGLPRRRRPSAFSLVATSTSSLSSFSAGRSKSPIEMPTLRPSSSNFSSSS